MGVTISIKDEDVEPIPANYTTISGTLMACNVSLFVSIHFEGDSVKTTEVIMANWSTEMWQNVVNRCGSNADIGSVWIEGLLGICQLSAKTRTPL
ncbi:hypothetical protein KIN20_015475 [Parelaphostrongylus tenuis]|uniref:Uncharacterized protein n=1 Tax=Parelaphostrongylus tenuis TaxID=148309 RepID=A0AAD5QSH9_PARTN|nr:hypothetical protein KIN20_015475 [Parelaphostrongylus tenuis]